MFELHIEAREVFDESTNEFITIKEQTLELEHSLASIAKWEGIHEKPFFSEKGLGTVDDLLDYIICMCQTPVEKIVIQTMNAENLKKIENYMNAKMTATTFSNQENGNKKRDIITAEIIYYWMISLQIPFECEHWHINRLLTLIRVCSLKNSPKKKMSKREMAAQRRQLNAQRMAQRGTTG